MTTAWRVRVHVEESTQRPLMVLEHVAHRLHVAERPAEVVGVLASCGYEPLGEADARALDGAAHLHAMRKAISARRRALDGAAHVGLVSRLHAN